MKRIFVLIWTVAVALGLISDQSFAQVQYLIDGKNPFTLHLETIPPNNCQTVTIALDPAGVIENSLISAGCGINYDVSQVLIANLVVADAAVGGPWDSACTSAVPDAAGPGTYMVVVCNFDTVPTNAPIPICDVEFCCQGPGVSEIDIFTGYAFTVVVGDSTVYDPIIDSGLINLTQTVPAYGEAIPTLSEWGMIIFMTIILGSGVVFILRRKMA